MKRLSLILLLATACAGPNGPIPGELLPEVDGVSLELFYFVQGPDARTRLGGLSGAIHAPGLDLQFQLTNGESFDLVPDELGRFELDLGPTDETTGTLRRGEVEVSGFERRDAEDAIRLAVWPPVGGAGSVPNDLVFIGEGEAARLLLVRSGDHALSVFDPALGLDIDQGLRLPERPSRDGPLAAQPWFVAPVGEGERAAVTAFLQHRTYLIHLPTMSIEAEFAVESRVRLETPITLPYPVDLEGEGTLASTLMDFRPRSPQGVLARGDALFVAYSGFVAPRLGPSLPPIYLPGVLARFSLSAPTAAPRLLTLPFSNPQALGFDDAGQRLIVTASGVLDAEPKIRATSSGGVMLIDPSEMTVLERHDLGDFAPGSTLMANGALWMSSLVRPEVMCVPLDGRERQSLRLNDEEVDSVFRLLELPGGLIGAPSFNTDQLHIIDPIGRTIDPAPFFAPLSLGPGRPIFDGLQVIARRPGRLGVDFVGPDLFALSGLASRVVPLELRKVLGP